MASVLSPSRPVAPVSSETSPNLSAIAFAALGYVADKEGDRDSLTDGAAHDIGLTVSGTIDDQPFAVSIDGRLTIGHASEKASSSTPNIAHIVAALLSKLNKATREKIARELPAEFAANGHAFPELPVGDVAEAENLLAAFRQSKRVKSRGPVKLSYELGEVESEVFSVVG